MPIVRRSRKRDAILEQLQATDCHPTADWVHREMRKQYPDISLGTVYRNLNQLCEEGLVWRIGMTKGQERFDACVTPHAHFVCNRCGAVIDLPDRAPGRAYIPDLSKQYEFVVDGYEFKLRGICKDCQQILKQEEN